MDINKPTTSITLKGFLIPLHYTIGPSGCSVVDGQAGQGDLEISVLLVDWQDFDMPGLPDV